VDAAAGQSSKLSVNPSAIPNSLTTNPALFALRLGEAAAGAWKTRTFAHALRIDSLTCHPSTALGNDESVSPGDVQMGQEQPIAEAFMFEDGHSMDEQ
jgi:hypothetical protein